MGCYLILLQSIGAIKCKLCVSCSSRRLVLAIWIGCPNAEGGRHLTQRLHIFYHVVISTVNTLRMSTFQVHGQSSKGETKTSPSNQTHMAATVSRPDHLKQRAVAVHMETGFTSQKTSSKAV
eukprot:1936978-Pleurochrysis_carterae.AAC.8